MDKAAAARFIKAGLVSQDAISGFFPGTHRRTTNSLQAGNDKYDLERAEQQAKERARAHIKFEQTLKDIASKRKVDEVEGVDEDSDSSESDSSSESSAAAPEEAPPASAIPTKLKKQKKKQMTDNSDSAQTSGNSTPQGTSKKARATAAKKAKREKLKVKRERKKQKRNSEKWYSLDLLCAT